MTHSLRHYLLTTTVHTANILNSSFNKSTSSNLTFPKREENQKLSKNNLLIKVMKHPEKGVKVLCLTFYLNNSYL